MYVIWPEAAEEAALGSWLRHIVEAVAQLDFSTVIVACIGRALSLHVPTTREYRDNALADFERILQGARIIVAAVKCEPILSGQVAFESRHRSGKLVVVTTTAGIDDYVANGRMRGTCRPSEVAA